MCELLDRAFQRKMLVSLQKKYPRAVGVNDLCSRQDYDRALYNLSYMHEYRLVNFVKTIGVDGHVSMGSVSITAQGIDFLADDGGLGAILGVVTVKLHEDTIKQLLIEKIEAAEGDADIKASLIAKIKETPAEAIGKLTERALDAGLNRIPDLLKLLRDWL